MPRLSQLSAERSINIAEIALTTPTSSLAREKLVTNDELRELRDQYFELVVGTHYSWKDWVDLSRTYLIWDHQEAFFTTKYPQDKLWQSYVHYLKMSTKLSATRTNNDALYFRLLAVGRRLFPHHMTSLPSDLGSNATIIDRMSSRISTIVSTLSFVTSVAEIAVFKEAFPDLFATTISPFLKRENYEKTMEFEFNKNVFEVQLEAFRIVFPEWKPSQQFVALVMSTLQKNFPTHYLDNTFAYEVLTCDELEVGNEGLKFIHLPKTLEEPKEDIPIMRNF